MKKIKSLIIAFTFAILTTSSFSQTASQAPATVPSSSTSVAGDPTLKDPAIGKRLQADLSYRTLELGKQPVSWYQSSNGYYANYSIGDKDFTANYDKEGKYQQTFVKGDWNDGSVPEPVKTSFQKSPYKSQEVVSYWSAADPNSPGYYIETKNKNGKVSKIWVDENGKLSKSPKSTSLTASK